MRYALPCTYLEVMDQHTIFSFLIAYWPVWVVLAVTWIPWWFNDEDDTTYWIGDQQISRAEYEDLNRPKRR